MEARELRIGNWVKGKGNTRRITTIKPPHLYDVSQFEPIPLTEEWLLRLGFKKRVTIGHSVQYFIGINPVTQDWLFDIVWQDSQEFPFYRNGHFKIQHVHQLQNLYFALTGEELVLTKWRKRDETTSSETA